LPIATSWQPTTAISSLQNAAARANSLVFTVFRHFSPLSTLKRLGWK